MLLNIALYIHLYPCTSNRKMKTIKGQLELFLSPCLRSDKHDANIWTFFSPKTLLPVNKQTKIGAAVGEEPATSPLVHH